MSIGHESPTLQWMYQKEQMTNIKSSHGINK